MLLYQPHVAINLLQKCWKFCQCTSSSLLSNANFRYASCIFDHRMNRFLAELYFMENQFLLFIQLIMWTNLCLLASIHWWILPHGKRVDWNTYKNKYFFPPYPACLSMTMNCFWIHQRTVPTTMLVTCIQEPSLCVCHNFKNNKWHHNILASHAWISFKPPMMKCQKSSPLALTVHHRHLSHQQVFYHKFCHASHFYDANCFTWNDWITVSDHYKVIPWFSATVSLHLKIVLSNIFGNLTFPSMNPDVDMDIVLWFVASFARNRTNSKVILCWNSSFDLYCCLTPLHY